MFFPDFTTKNNYNLFYEISLVSRVKRFASLI